MATYNCESWTVEKIYEDFESKFKKCSGLEKNMRKLKWLDTRGNQKEVKIKLKKKLTNTEWKNKYFNIEKNSKIVGTTDLRNFS